MRSVIGLLLLYVLSLQSAVAAGTFIREPTCQGVAGQARWGVKLLRKNEIRFTIDATDLDTCTEISQIEFVASLLNGAGKVVATKSFAVPELVIVGPSIASRDYVVTGYSFVDVQGVALHGWKRTLGGRPSTSMARDPVTEHAAQLAKEFKGEKSTYSQWLGASQPDYYEYRVVGSADFRCSVREVKKETSDQVVVACDEAKRQAEEKMRDRHKEFGEPILPRGEAAGIDQEHNKKGG